MKISLFGNTVMTRNGVLNYYRGLTRAVPLYYILQCPNVNTLNCNL